MRITRRTLLKSVGLTLPILGLGKNMGNVFAAGEQGKKFNVLFLGYDDLRPEISAYGCAHMKTPNFERLATMSVQFNHAYVQQAVCAASRASFLTGCRPDTTGVNYPYTPWFVNTFLPAHPDIGQVFFQQGYFTRYLGKLHHGPHPDLSENYFPGTKHVYAIPEHQLDTPRPTWKDKLDPWEQADVPDDAYRDGEVAQETIETIRRAMREDKPFFIGVGFHAPHMPYCVPQKYWDMYDPETIKLPQILSLNEGQPEFTIKHSQLTGWTSVGDPADLSEAMLRKLTHGYYASVSYGDALLGSILDELERQNLLDSTIIMVWGDQGYHLGEHGMWGKGTLYEEANLAPLYVRVPGIAKAGQQSDALVEYVDMYPTLLNLCGFEIPDYVEGTSMAELLKNPTREWKKAAFSQFPRSLTMEGYTVRTRDFRYNEWKDKEKQEVIARELYDHRSDPGEARNVVNEPEYAEHVKALSAMLHAGWQEALPPGYTNAANNPPGDDSAYARKNRNKEALEE